MGLLSFIFWCIVVFYALGLAGRLLLRWYIRRKQREFEEGRFGTGRQQQQHHRPDSREGEVRIEQIDPKAKHVSRSVGEYVDYEEVPPENDSQSSDK